MKPTYQALASSLLEIGAVKFGEFRLKLHESQPQAPLSPIYVDLRLMRSFPDVLDAASEVYGDLMQDVEFDLLADVPTAATPVVAVLSHMTRAPMVSPRIGGKTHGTMGDIDGAFNKGQRVVLIDDLITHADSKLEAISTLEHNGLTVASVVVLVDREQGGSEELRRRGYQCLAAFTMGELLDHYLETGGITEEQHTRTMDYLRGS
jgi:uridine monophosphate synthetase